MSATLNWMPLYVRDYDEDTGHLTCEQDGAYGRLLRKMWLRGDLPNDDSNLSRICGVSRTHWVRHLKPAIMPLLLVTDIGTLSQKRLQKERKKAEKISEIRAENGRKIRENTPPLSNHINDVGLALAHANRGTNEEHLLVQPQYTEEDKKKERKSTPTPIEHPDHRRIVDAWNAMAAVAGVPKIRVVSLANRKHLNARMAEHGLEGVLAAIKAVGESDLCRGLKDGWNGADFEWLISNALKFERTLRGQYANKTGSRPVQISPDSGRPVVRLSHYL
jgi:uncharacterized protein YdaU (DUF1376 family)